MSFVELPPLVILREACLVLAGEIMWYVETGTSLANQIDLSENGSKEIRPLAEPMASDCSSTHGAKGTFWGR